MADITELLDRAAFRPSTPVDPADLARRRRRRTHRRRAAAAVTLAMAGAGVVTLRPRGEERVVTADVPLVTDVAPGTVPPPATMAGTDVDLMVWMEPEASAGDVAAVGDAITTSRVVESFVYRDQTAEYDEFVRWFADEPELLETVRPDQLPSRFLIDVRAIETDTPSPDEALQDEETRVEETVTLAAELALLPGVRAVVEPAGPGEEASPLTSLPPGFGALPD